MNRLARLCPDAVAFEYRSIDRLILNAYIPTLQTPGAMAYFLRGVRHKPILSGIVFKELTDDFIKRTRDFAQEHGLSIQSPRGMRPGELGQQMLAKARKQGRFGVVGIIAHQERARVFCSTHGGGRATNFRVKEDRRMVNHYYFYIRDRQYGEGFVRICTYPPFATRIWFNGHGYLASRMAEQGIATQFDENCVVSCADPQALQKAADEFDSVRVEQIARHWLQMVPSPLSAEERAAGYETRLSIFQAEFSDNLIFHKTAVLNRLYEQVLSEHMHLGRPDMIKATFDRRITRKTPGKFKTRILREGTVACMKVFYKNSFLKQYNKSGRVLRTELCVNNPNDFGSRKGLAHLGQLSRIAEHTTTRFTEAQAVARSTALDRSAFERMVTPSQKDEGKRVAALRFGTTWVMQLLMALGCAGLCFGAFSNQDVCRVLVEQLGVAEEQARPTRVGYELRKLRGKGLVHKARGRNRYTLTPLGQRVVPALVKFHQRLLSPTLDSFDQAVHRLCEQGNVDEGPPEEQHPPHDLDRLLHQLNRDMDALAVQCCFRDAA